MAERKGFDLGDYVEVKDRIRVFYESYGAGRLVTSGYELTNEPDGKPKVIVTALAYRSVDDPHPGVGTSWMYLPGKTSYTAGSEIENVETSAWGRAIGSLGILIDRSIASANEIEAKRGAPKAEDDAESTYAAGDWTVVGKAEAGANGPVDGNLRPTPDGGIFGFVIVTADKKRFQVVAEGPMALPVSLVWDSLNGQEVHASGHTELVPWSKEVDGKKRNMPPYRRIHAERIESAEIVIPAMSTGPVSPEAAGAPSEELAAVPPALSEADEAELDALVLPLGKS